MKNKFKTSVFAGILAAGMALGSTGFAEPAAPQTGSAGDKVNKPWKQKNLAHRKLMKAKLDTNKDGKVDPAEKQAGIEAWKAKRAKLVAQADTNGDGVLSKEEAEIGFQKFKEAKAAQLAEKTKTD